LTLCKGEQEMEWATAQEDAKKLKTGIMMTEFGAVSGNSTAALKSIEFTLDKANDVLQSWAYWQFKSYGDFTTASSSIFFILFHCCCFIIFFNLNRCRIFIQWWWKYPNCKGFFFFLFLISRKSIMKQLEVLSRPYPVAIAGHGKSFKFDAVKKIATLVVEPSTVFI